MQTENEFSARDFQTGILLQRDLMAQREHQQHQHQQQLDKESILREEIVL